MIPWREFCRRDDGSTTLEFALVLPVLTLVVSLFVQGALLVQAYLVVHRAAFEAARSAVVWIPAETRDEPSMVLGDRGEKRDHVNSAAAFACAVLAPTALRGGSGGGTASGLAGLLARLPAARLLTRVELPGGTYREHQPVTVIVEHDFVLQVPGTGAILGRPLLGLFGPYVHTVRATAALTNQSDGFRAAVR